MTATVFFLPEASNDVIQAMAWYNEQMPGLGKAFLAEVNRQVRHISFFPDSYPRLNASSRRANMRRFPYAIVYRAQPSAIEVIAVFHYRTNTFVT